MKKLLFAVPIVALLAAGCNSTQQANNEVSTASRAQDTTVANTATTTPAQTHSTSQSGWTTYTNSDLGISFSYPASYRVYQQDATHLTVNSDYKDPKYPEVRTIQMGISQVSQTPETTAQVEARFLPNIGPWTTPDLKAKLSTQTHSSQTVGNYTLFTVHDDLKGTYYYIQSDKGTFLIDSSLQMFGQLWNQQNLDLQTYSNIFGQIVSSIKIN